MSDQTELVIKIYREIGEIGANVKNLAENLEKSLKLREEDAKRITSLEHSRTRLATLAVVVGSVAGYIGNWLSQVLR